MGFIRWVGGFVKSIPADVVKVLRGAAHMVIVIWTLLQTLGGLVHRAWRALTTGVEAFASDVADLAASTYHALRQILLHTIPRAIEHALAAASREARRLAGDVRAWAVDAIRTVTALAHSLANDVRSWAREAMRALSDVIGALSSDVSALIRKLSPILGGPATLAAWLAEEMWRALWSLFRSQEKAIARYLFRHAKGLALAAAADIEAIIAELF